MLKRELSSLAAALLFLAHPMHVESICPIVGRADCLCGVFYLSALLVYRRSTQTEKGKGKGIIQQLVLSESSSNLTSLQCLHVLCICA